jgi:hypothetical protein
MKSVRWLSTHVAAWLLVSLALAAQAAPPASNHLVIRTLSTDAASVSGDDVLVMIEVPSTASPSNVEVALNGAPITSTFLPASGNALVGLVSGLQPGVNVLVAKTKNTNPSLSARLEIQNFPAYGPVCAGPHQDPWICETARLGLGAPLDEHCTVPVRYDWLRCGRAR